MVTENVNIVVTTRGARVAQQRIRGIGRSSRLATTAVRSLGVALATIGVGLGVRELFRLSDAATEVGNRIRTVTSSTEVFLSVQERLFDVASRTGSSIEDTARLYQRLAVGTRDIGVGSARVINVVEGLNAALVVSGSTAREASAALLQLGQGLASDNLSGEELRSLRENLPQLAQGLAAELGVGIGALKELGRQGKLNAETIFPALERAIGKFQEQLRNGDVVFTFAQAFSAVRNEILKAFTIIQGATGITQDLNKAIFEFSDGLAERIVNVIANLLESSITLVAVFDQVRTGVGQAIDAVGGFINALLLIKDVSIALIDVIIAPFVAARSGLAQLALSITSLGNRLGLGGIFGDEELAAQTERAQRSTEALALVMDDLSERAANIGERLGGGVVDAAEGAENALTPLQQRIVDIANSLRNAAANPPDVTDDPDREFTFLERATRRQGRIAEERGTEQIDVPADLSESISTSFREGFAGAIKNGDNLFGAFSDNLEAAANESLINGFQNAFDQAEALLGEAFESAATALGPVLEKVFGDSAGPLGQALSGALQFVALQALSALFGGGGNKSSSSSGNVQSAVTSTQAVRGIVAGPQEIAIANVGQNIEQAFQPMLQETRAQTDVLRTIAGLIAAGGTGSVGLTSPDTLALATGSAPLATS